MRKAEPVTLKAEPVTLKAEPMIQRSGVPVPETRSV
jgi:hypothetical protein